MTRMVANAEPPLDHLGHAPTGPQIGAVTRVKRPAKEDSHQLFFLSAIQTRFATGMRFGVQGIETAPIDGILPFLNGGFGRFDNTCHFADGFSFQQELAGNFPPGFRSAGLWSVYIYNSTHPLFARQGEGQ